MKKFYSFLAAVIFAVFVHAQSANFVETPAPAKTSESNNSQPQPARAKEGKVEIPPEKAKPIVIPKIETPPTIDGKLDEEVWKKAAVFKDFYQTGPGYNTAPSKPTEAYLLYDEKNLYIGFKCWDDKDKIRATVAKRDNVFGEDNVRVWLDTYDDHRRAYVLGFNPFGIQQDGILTEGSNNGADFSVDIVMESKGVIEDWGWSVEVKVPFKSLRYTAGKGKNWGFNAARNIDRFNDEFDQWMPDDRDVSGFLIKSGKITGLDEIKYERTLEIVPSVTISETGNRKSTLSRSRFNTFGRFDAVTNPIGLQDPGRFVNDPGKADLGLTLKYTLSPNVTLDAAINPDFAEIEADAPVVTANQRFPIFFQEKRPFFLEGKEIFDSPLQPFYSRTIVDPDIAAKLTGKTGKNSFGFLLASDNAPGNYSQDERGELNACKNLRQTDIDAGLPQRRCAIEEFLGKNAYFGVLRLKHDIGTNNNIGFFATARTFPKNRNFTGGFDGVFKLNPRTVMTFQVLGTHSRKTFYDPKEDEANYRTGNGLGYYWSDDYTTDTHGWFAELTGRSKNYRTDAGFTRRTNINTAFFANRFSTKSNPKGKIIRVNWSQFGRWGYDWDGRTQEGLVGNNLNFTLKGNLFIFTEFGVGYEKDYESDFGAIRNPAKGIRGAFFGAATRSAYQPYFSVNFNKTVNKRLSTYGFVGSIINSIDYDFGAGNRYPRTSPAYRSYLASPEFQDYIRQLFIYQAIPNPDPDLRPSPPPEPGLDPGRGYQFDLNLGFEYKPIDPFRISLDYTKSKLTRNDNHLVAYNTNIFILRSTYQFTRFTFVRARLDYDTLRSSTAGQFLVGWNPSPGTAFYVGYNDNFNYGGFNPFTGQHEPGFERNSRTFFIRASYLFRKSF